MALYFQSMMARGRRPTQGRAEQNMGKKNTLLSEQLFQQSLHYLEFWIDQTPAQNQIWQGMLYKDAVISLQ